MNYLQPQALQFLLSDVELFVRFLRTLDTDLRIRAIEDYGLTKNGLHRHLPAEWASDLELVMMKSVNDPSILPEDYYGTIWEKLPWNEIVLPFIDKGLRIDRKLAKKVSYNIGIDKYLRMIIPHLRKDPEDLFELIGRGELTPTCGSYLGEEAGYELDCSEPTGELELILEELTTAIRENNEVLLQGIPKTLANFSEVRTILEETISNPPLYSILRFPIFREVSEPELLPYFLVLADFEAATLDGVMAGSMKVCDFVASHIKGDNTFAVYSVSSLEELSEALSGHEQFNNVLPEYKLGESFGARYVLDNLFGAREDGSEPLSDYMATDFEISRFLIFRGNDPRREDHSGKAPIDSLTVGQISRYRSEKLI